jgi:two-component system sensor histidine kinase SenX3
MPQSPSVKNVNTPTLISLALFFGVVVGGFVVWVLSSRSRRGKMPTTAAATNAIVDGAAEVLDVLATAGIVLDGSNTVLRSTAGAQAFGLVQNRLLIHSVLVALVDRVRATGETENLETSVTTGLRGTNLWIHARAARLADRFVLLLVEDRTESKRLEETRRDFVANISHELKTPIGAIGLLAEALQDGSDDPELVKKFAGNLYRESRRLAHLVQDIIQLSRLQSAETVTNAQLIDLAGIISEAVERNLVIAENKNIKLASSAPSGIEVFGDHEQLAVAVKNLIENAVLYSDEGSQVGIGLRAENGIAEIAVTDSGVGIPAEEQERIFERFYRVDPSRSRQTGGTGLGLSIVKHIAMNHRGEVRLFSQVGLGSTFTLRIPLADAETIETATSNSTEDDK